MVRSAMRHAILGQDGVRDGSKPKLVVFVAVAAQTASSIEQDEARRQVKGWASHFGMSTYASITTSDSRHRPFFV